MFCTKKENQIQWQSLDSAGVSLGRVYLPGSILSSRQLLKFGVIHIEDNLEFQRLKHYKVIVRTGKDPRCR